MSSHRPTTIERAYQLAREGGCRSVGEIRHRLSAEKYERIQESLYGPSVTRALKALCQQHYAPPIPPTPAD